jgi:hypothetical protein
MLFWPNGLFRDIGGHFEGFEAIPTTDATYESHESYPTRSRVVPHRVSGLEEKTK